MQKRILIIGNDDGLPGVKVDFENYKRFFKSNYGGEWSDVEIIEKLNVSKADLLTQLISLKAMKLDYLIVVFSGHGGQERETMLELNSKGECIAESDLKNLAHRQLNIYDCCRSYPQLLLDSVRSEMKLKLYSFISTRLKFEKRIMEASHQQVCLYACSIGEVANDTSKGGAYSKNLINCSISDTNEYTLVGTAHEAASILTTVEFSKQHPDSVIPRYFTSQQLIIGVKS